MSHESVWYSHPRTYGKGARSWFVRSSFIPFHTLFPPPFPPRPHPFISLFSHPVPVRLPSPLHLQPASDALPTEPSHSSKIIHRQKAHKTNLRYYESYSRANGDKKKSGIIRKYGLNMSRQAFREHAEEIGFVKTR